MTTSIYIELLYRALDSSIGIVVRTSDPERARARFYEARRTAQNPAFDDLTICPSRSLPDTHLWLVRKRPASTANGAFTNGQT
jgi:hypothetical protein